MNNDNVDKHLNRIQEFDPIVTTTAVTGTVYVAFLLSIVFMYAAYLQKMSKPHKQLTQELNKILKRNDLVVNIMPLKESNAFVMAGKNIYVTPPLKKLLTKRELMAILLHEVHHLNKKHSLKRLASTLPFFYIVAYLKYTIASYGGNVFIAMLLALALLGIAGIPQSPLFVQKQELASDENVIKYGYRDDLISAFEKFKKEEQERQKGKKCGRMCKIINKLEDYLSTHPTLENRIKNLLSKPNKLEQMAKTKNVKQLKNYILKRLEA
jgi:STE24 endopeptidase